MGIGAKLGRALPQSSAKARGANLFLETREPTRRTPAQSTGSNAFSHLQVCAGSVGLDWVRYMGWFHLSHGMLDGSY